MLGSSRDSIDHLAAQRLLSRVSSGPFKSHRYVFRDGDADAIRTLQRGTGAALVTGFNATLWAQHRAGQLRVLGTSSERRLIAELPTWVEQGALAGLFANWRGLFARPDLPERVLRAWLQVMESPSNSAVWREVLQAHGWSPRWRAGADFASCPSGTEGRIAPVVRRGK